MRSRATTPRRRTTQRPKSRRNSAASRRPAAVRGLVGRDFSAFEQRPGPRKLIPVAIALLLAGFGLAALRTEVLRLRYELAEGVERESKLQIERKDLTVEMRALRHPVALGERALEMGFVRADRIVDVPAHPVQSRADAAAPQQLSDLGSLAAADASVAEPGVRP